MSTESVAPNPQPNRAIGALKATLRSLFLLVLVAAIAVGAAYGVFEYRIKAEQSAATAQIDALRQELRGRQDGLDGKLLELEKLQSSASQELTQQMNRVQQAAEAAKLLFAQNGETTTLDARMKELDTLKLDLQKTRAELDTKLKTMEKSVIDQIAAQGKETAQALSIELRYKSLLIKAQGEILLAQVHWTDGNRGFARDELSIAATTLRQALEAAPESVQTRIKPVFDLAEQTKAAMILEQPAARDSMNLLWHKVSELLIPDKP